MTVTVGTLRKLTTAGTPAAIKAELRTAITDWGGTIVDDYVSGNTFVVSQETLPGYATPVFFQWQLTGVVVTLNAVYLTWNAVSHAGGTLLANPAINIGGFSPSSSAWQTTSGTSWSQSLSGSNWRALTFHYSTISALASPDLTVNFSGLSVRFCTIENPAQAYPAGFPPFAVMVGTALNLSGLSANTQNVYYVLYSGGVYAPAVASLANFGTITSTLPNGQPPSFKGHFFLGLDGNLNRVGSSDLLSIAVAGLNVYTARNYPAGDRIIVSAGVEEYIVTYPSNGTGNGPSGLLELARTV